MAEEKKTFIERRRGPDAVIKAVWWISGISWVLIITAVIFAGLAKPENETFFDRLFNIRVRGYWDYDLLRYAFIILLLNFVTCIVGFILNLFRQKRKTDRINKSVILLAAVSLAGILWFVIRWQ
ncbi:MAG: hypothetical protein ACM3XR_09725 [Bacillota bacterium]